MFSESPLLSDWNGFGDDYGYPGLLRQVDLRIQGRYVNEVPAWASALGIIPVVIANWGKTMQGVKAMLDNAGWIVENIADESGWTGDYVYRITATVGTNYTDGEIQQQIQRDLAGFFTVSGVSTLSPPYSPSSGGYVYQAGNLGTVNVYGGGPSANYTQTPPAGNPATGGNGGGSDFLANLGLGAGISTPIALLGGAVVLALILRK